MKINERELGRQKRHIRLRKKVRGTSARPRLAVFKSNRYIYAQIIDDNEGVTLAAASSLEAGLKSEFEGKLNLKSAEAVGKLISLRAKGKGISTVVFDRGGFLYHGRIKALAEAARSNGLIF
ncbi:MAG: 50S ribosomal protein L18 [Deferribacteraceae bacterium]|nr:50S ribosomal protein L18 [Deferribacteraceae bacterium]